MRLYHSTCDHGRAGIGRSGTIKPNRHPFLGVDLIWLDANPDATREDTGLTSNSGLLTCDRYTYLYEVFAPKAQRWLDSPIRAQQPEEAAMLEAFGKPETWYISAVPVRGRLVRVRR